jgi:branched-chain amino acid transport system substrate-binding protein
MVDKPFKVGTNGQHQFNRNGLPMRLETGRWRIAHVQGVSE